MNSISLSFCLIFTYGRVQFSSYVYALRIIIPSAPMGYAYIIMNMPNTINSIINKAQ